MDNEPPLVPKSGSMVYKWIANQIGSSPEMRKKYNDNTLQLLRQAGLEVHSDQVSPLLFAMTKFNVELSGKGDAEELGNPDVHNSKWQARLQTNFADYMGKPVTDKWPLSWIRENDAFKFIFPIRDPGFSRSFFNGYEAKLKTESSLRPESADMIAEMQESFLSSPVVQKFIFEPKTLWKELLTPNKSGLDYLCNYLLLASHPINLFTQLDSLYNRVMQRIIKNLQHEFISNDRDAELKKAKRNGAIASMAYVGLRKKHLPMLASYLKSRQIQEDEIWELLYQSKFFVQEAKQDTGGDISVLKNFLEEQGIGSTNLDTKEGVLEELKDFFEVDEASLKEILQEQLDIDLDASVDAIVNHDSYSYTTMSRILGFWYDRLQHENDFLVNAVPNLEKVHQALQEIINSKKVIAVEQKIETLIDKELKQSINESKFNFLSAVISSTLNNFTYQLAYASELEVANDEDNLAYDITALEELVKKNTSSGYTQSLALGLKRIFENNVNERYNLGNKYDSARNDKIGEMLSQLKELL